MPLNQPGVRRRHALPCCPCFLYEDSGHITPSIWPQLPCIACRVRGRHCMLLAAHAPRAVTRATQAFKLLVTSSLASVCTCCGAIMEHAACNGTESAPAPAPPRARPPPQQQGDDNTWTPAQHRFMLMALEQVRALVIRDGHATDCGRCMLSPRVCMADALPCPARLWRHGCPTRPFAAGQRGTAASGSADRVRSGGAPSAHRRCSACLPVLFRMMSSC